MMRPPADTPASDQNFRRREPAEDFVIQGPLDHGVSGLINLFGIESPGVTSSLAIADYVSKLI